MLEGLRIIEIEGLGPAPFAAMLLADLGADVIVVHRKNGRPAPGMPERSLIDRGKRSIELDLKSADDTAVLKSLVRKSEALIEGFRPGVMERLGLGPDDLSQVNPDLVYGRMTGWGQTGRGRRRPGHDLNYVSLSGAAWYASNQGEPPFTPPTLVGDIGGGALYLVTGVLAGVMAARAGRSGTAVDAAIVDGSAHDDEPPDGAGPDRWPVDDAWPQPARRSTLEPLLCLRRWRLYLGAMPGTQVLRRVPRTSRSCGRC